MHTSCMPVTIVKIHIELNQMARVKEIIVLCSGR